MKNNSTRKFYDEAFTEIFSNPKITESLLRDIVKEPWVNLIDYTHLEVYKSTYKNITDNKRESDLLLKFPLISHPLENFYIYIMMEFQSTPAAMIPRILEYLAKSYKAQLKKQKKLFPIIPLVLYNGNATWKENPEFTAYFNVLSPELKKYIPLFSYFLIDITHFSEDKLKEIKSAASYFFQLDKTDITEEKKSVKKILTLLKILKEGDREIFTLISRYTEELLHYKGLDIKEINNYIKDRGETMLAQSIDKLKEMSRQKGLEQGIQEGEIRGKLEGKLEGQLENKRQIALNLLNEGSDIDFISKITDLTEKEILELQNNS